MGFASAAPPRTSSCPSSPGDRRPWWPWPSSLPSSAAIPPRFTFSMSSTRPWTQRYRAAVAALIKKQATPLAEDMEGDIESESTQFICSTFRPELVAAANRCFGISHQNKVSSLHLLSKNDALHFIANLMSEEEALGDVTSLATSKAVGSSRGSGVA